MNCTKVLIGQQRNYTSVCTCIVPYSNTSSKKNNNNYWYVLCS